MTYPLYQTYKAHPDHDSRHLDDFSDLDKAIASAKALHDPDWPAGQHITVFRFDDVDDCGIREFTTAF